MRTSSNHNRAVATILALALLAAGCGSDSASSPGAADRIALTAGQVRSLDSTGQVIVQANPGNADLKSLVDSTLMVLSAGIEARRVPITTTLTTAPLYLVGVHRTASGTGGSSSTWTLVAMDDPGKLVSLIEVAGFAQTPGATPPASVSGTIGDGTGVVNATMIQVAAGGAVTQWRAGTGTVTISSDVPSGACPNYQAPPKITCGLETMHVRFTANASIGSGGATARSAALATDADVPAIRLTYTP